VATGDDAVRRIAAAALSLLLLAGCTSSTNGSGSTNRSGTSSTTTAPSTPSTSAPPTTTPASSSTAPVPRSGPLNGFQISDLTFVGAEGWALGTVGCVQTSGRCTALAHSTDNGRNWRSIVAPPVHVEGPAGGGSCADPCVQHVRFASRSTGYLFGVQALYLTTDSGRHWRRQSGGADALESLDGNVIRVDDRGGCPPGCTYTVRTAAIGSASWHAVTLPGPPGLGDGVALARTGSHAYLLVGGNPAGGAENEKSRLWTSADDGAHWTNRGEPCPQGGSREVDSSLLSTSDDGAAAVLCTTRGGSGRSFVAISTNGGASFRAGSRTALGGAPVSALGLASSATVLLSSDDTYRSTDSAQHFARLSSNSGSSPGVLGWLGFASATVGHAISVDRRSIWTTTDGGRSWGSGHLH
jgi:hypothetical protein